MLLVNRLNNINSQIDSYQEKIAELQRRVTELQAHAQEVQVAESAAESALVQIRTALDMITAICPDDITTFKAAVDALFAPKPLLLAAEETDIPSTSNPVEPNPPINNEVMDVDSTPVDESQPETNGNSNGHNGKVSVEELKKLKRPVLVRLAKNYSIEDFNNKTRDKLAELLAGKVSRNVLDPLFLK
jgi:TolA-binding protein